jgi:hypothetical protein
LKRRADALPAFKVTNPALIFNSLHRQTSGSTEKAHRLPYNEPLVRDLFLLNSKTLLILLWRLME